MYALVLCPLFYAPASCFTSADMTAAQDYFKIFMGFPTTGGPAKPKKD